MRKGHDRRAPVVRARFPMIDRCARQYDDHPRSATIANRIHRASGRDSSNARASARAVDSLRVRAMTPRATALTSASRHVRARAIYFSRRLRVRPRRRAMPTSDDAAINRAINRDAYRGGERYRAGVSRATTARATTARGRGRDEWCGNKWFCSRSRAWDGWTDVKTGDRRAWTQAARVADDARAPRRDRVPRELATDVVPGHGRAGAPEG